MTPRALHCIFNVHLCMKAYLEKHHRIFGIIGAVAAFVIAIIYLKITPAEASTASGFQKIILVYGHSLCWILLGGASILWAKTRINKWSGLLAYAALAAYAAFVVTLLAARFM